MRGTRPAWWLCVAIATGAVACGADGPPNTPSAPSPVGGDDDGGGIAVRPPHKPGADDDAGAGDAGSPMFLDAGGFEPVRRECKEQIPPDPLDMAPDGTFTNALSSPVDLGVSRVEATWDGDCIVPTIRITLSDGQCPLGKGHEVELQFDARAIADGKLTRGVHYLEPEPGKLDIRVRYRRPASLDPLGAGEWGTCLGVTGMIELPETPGVDARDELRGRFTMNLTPCDDVNVETRAVNGTFDVTLERGLDDVCPTTK